MADYSDYTDEQLVSLLEEMDEQAFAIIYRRYFELLLRHAHRMLQDTEEAGDVVQDVFVKLWEKRATLTVERSLSAYLYVATQNSVLRRIERSKRGETYLEIIRGAADRGIYATDEEIQLRELKYLIEQEITQLPQKMQTVFRLSREQHLSNAEIANKLGVSKNTVKRQISNSLQMLRKKLDTLFFFFLIIISLYSFFVFI